MATGRPCTVCSHSEREEIDRALVAAGTAVKPLSSRFGLTTKALARHRDNHLPRAALDEAAQAIAEAEGARGASLLQQATSLRDRALELLKKAEDAGDLRTALHGIREARGCLELMAKLAGEIDDRATVNVILSPQWLQVQAVILTALETHPAARVAVVRALEAVR